MAGLPSIPALAVEAYVASAGDVAQRVPENEAVVAWVGFGELGEFPVVPLEVAAVDNDAANGRAVTADVFGGRKNDDVRAVLDGSYKADAHGVIHDERDACFMGDGREFFKVGHVEFGIANGLGADGPGARGNGFAETSL